MPTEQLAEILCDQELSARAEGTAVALCSAAAAEAAKIIESLDGVVEIAKTATATATTDHRR